MDVSQKLGSQLTLDLTHKRLIPVVKLVRIQREKWLKDGDLLLGLCRKPHLEATDWALLPLDLCAVGREKKDRRGTAHAPYSSSAEHTQQILLPSFPRWQQGMKISSNQLASLLYIYINIYTSREWRGDRSICIHSLWSIQLFNSEVATLLSKESRWCWNQPVASSVQDRLQRVLVK